MVALLRSPLKVIVAVSLASLVLLVGTSLYASNGLVVTPSFSSEILNQKQNVEAVNPNRNVWLRLASVDDDHDYDDDHDHNDSGHKHKKDCDRRDRRGECRPLNKLKVNSLHKLQFGDIVSNSTQGQGARVVIDPVTGSKVVHSGVALGGRYGPAEFEIKGQPNKRFAITLPRQIVMTGKTGGGARVSELVAYLPSSRSSSTKDNGNLIGQLGRNGKAKLLVGGTLYLDSGRVTGSFKALLDVFVDYLP